MLSLFNPTWMVETIYNIKPSDLKANNIKAVITDLDNTLIAWNHPTAQEETINWIELMRSNGIKVVIISNNKGDRVEKVAKALDVGHLSRAAKPSRKGFKKFFNKYEYDKTEVLMVGDQVLTDILAANRFGIQNVLVRPLMDSDAWNTKINRFFEMLIMKYVLRKNLNEEWSETIGRRTNN